MINPPTEDYPYPSITIDRELLLTIEQRLRAEGCVYHMGGKAPSLNSDTSAIHQFDCSGFARYAIYRASGVDITDGSVVQHDWIQNHGFKRSTFTDAYNEDNYVRIAFLSPHASPDNIGHVMIILNGQTVESHGPAGSPTPDRRRWGSMSFMAHCTVFVLATPPSAPVAADAG